MQRNPHFHVRMTYKYLSYELAELVWDWSIDSHSLARTNAEYLNTIVGRCQD